MSPSAGVLPDAQIEAGQQLVDQITHPALPECPTLALIGTFAEFELGDRDWSVLAVPIDIRILGEALAQDPQ